MLTPAMMNEITKVAESFMVDACEILQFASGTTDQDLIYNPEPMDELYAGKCRITPTTPRDEVIGEEFVTFSNCNIYVPLSVILPVRDDVVKVTASNNAWLVDKIFRIVDVRSGTWEGSRQYSCVAIQSSRL